MRRPRSRYGRLKSFAAVTIPVNVTTNASEVISRLSPENRAAASRYLVEHGYIEAPEAVSASSGLAPKIAIGLIIGAIPGYLLYRYYRDKSMFIKESTILMRKKFPKVPDTIIMKAAKEKYRLNAHLIKLKKKKDMLEDRATRIRLDRMKRAGGDWRYKG